MWEPSNFKNREPLYTELWGGGGGRGEAIDGKKFPTLFRGLSDYLRQLESALSQSQQQLKAVEAALSESQERER